jgi:hypothetical protein
MPLSGHAAFQFQDISDAAGPLPFVESAGAAIADIDGDGYSDIFFTSHRMRPYVFRNEGNNRFKDITLRVDHSSTWVTFAGDQHTGTFADFDNDGDQDLIVATGANADGQLYVNHGGYFVDETRAYGIENDDGGWGRFWIDVGWNGSMDFISHEFNLSRLALKNDSHGFDHRNGQAAYSCGGLGHHIQLGDFNNDGKLDLLCVREAELEALYDISAYTDGLPFINITAQSFQHLTSTGGAIPNVADTATGDFDGDLATDLLVLRGKVRPNQAVHNRDVIEANLTRGAIQNEPIGFTFSGGQQIRVNIYSVNYTDQRPDRVRIGSQGVSPGGIPFTIDRADPRTWFLPAVSDTDPVLQVAFNPFAGEWTIQINSPPNRGSAVLAYVKVERLSGPDFDRVAMTKLEHGDRPLTPHLLMNRNGLLVDEAGKRGLGRALSCAGVVAGDFDNDMDEDLYFICRGGAENIPNRAFENRGGSFVEVPNGAGAAGPVGMLMEHRAGTGDTAVTSDFDADGCLDLLVMNGVNFMPGKVGGPVKLYRNTCNSNHWIQFDLQGTASNRDGLGAKVYLTAGGKTQVREQDGGYHRFSQDDRRIHFGLAGNTAIQELRVEWPSGHVNNYVLPRVDRVYRLIEGTGGIASGGWEEVALGGGERLAAPQPGDECGEPPYAHEYGPATLVWRDCPGNTWHVRAQGGRSPKSLAHRGSVTSSRALTGVVQQSLEGPDYARMTNPLTLDYQLNVQRNDVDGFDFVVAGDSASCFRLTSPNEPILVGQARWAVPEGFDLATLRACGGVSEEVRVSIADTTVREDAGVARLQVTLGNAARGPVSMRVATVAGTARPSEDYRHVSTTVTIPVGATVAHVEVPILNDLNTEETETFSVELSSIVGALPGDVSATVSIIDDDEPSVPGDMCGAPSFDPNDSRDRGVFIWKDCDGSSTRDTWHLRATGGGSRSWLTYEGEFEVLSTGAVGATGYELEPEDTVRNRSGKLTYKFLALGKGIDGLDLTVSGDVCFKATGMPSGANVRLGAGKRVMSEPFNMSTLGACGSTPPPPPTDGACGQPPLDVNSASDKGLFLWKDCASTGTSQSWHLAAVGGGSIAPLTFEGAFASPSTLSARGRWLEKTDALDVQANKVSYRLNVAREGLDFVDLQLPAGRTACLDTTQMPSGIGLRIGAGKTAVSAPLDLATLGPCTSAPPPSHDPRSCGAPRINTGSSSDRGLFLWRECGGSSSSPVWHLSAVGGGSHTALELVGKFQSDGAIGAVGQNLERTDVLRGAGTARVDFGLLVWRSGSDNLTLTLPANGTACFDPTKLSGTSVRVGAGKLRLDGAFDLESLGACR